MEISTILLFYLGTVLSCFIMLIIYGKMTQQKIVFDKKNIVITLFVSIIYYLNNIFMFNTIKILLAFCISLLHFKWICKDKFKQALYYTIVITIALYAIDLISALILPLWIKNVETLNNNIMFKFILSFIVNLFLYFILTNKYVVAFFQTNKSSKSHKIFYIIGAILLVICNVWAFYLAEDTANKTLNLVLGISEIVILIFSIIIIKSKYEKNLSQIKEEQLKQNLDLYSKVAYEYKELKHNLMNDLLIIKTKVKKNDQEFINQIINKYKSNYEWVNCITDIPDGLQGLVFLKKNQAEMKNINFNLEYNINSDIEKLIGINKNFKLYETLGILFDNAIEGAAESEEKMINIVFSNDKKLLHIKILNTFTNQIDLDKIGDENYSTKNRNSGIGLNYIRKQKNKFKVKQSINHNIFITEIIINLKEKK